jgi:hypothetical protein
MILAIETATELCGVALVDKHECIASPGEIAMDLTRD